MVLSGTDTAAITNRQMMAPRTATRSWIRCCLTDAGTNSAKGRGMGGYTNRNGLLPCNLPCGPGRLCRAACAPGEQLPEGLRMCKAGTGREGSDLTFLPLPVAL